MYLKTQSCEISTTESILIMRALIFAAGLGTRLRPITDEIPKALVPVAGKTLLEHTIHRLINAGTKEIVINVHHHARQIINFINERKWSIPIKISDESELLLNTGGGLKHALPLFSPPPAPILIHNVDILHTANLQTFTEHLGNADALLLVSRRPTQRYLLFDDDHKLVGWTNRHTGEVRSPYSHLNVNRCHAYAFSGIHCISGSFGKALANAPKVFSIMDFYLDHCTTLDIRGYVDEKLKLMDVGKINTLLAADSFLSKEGLSNIP